MKYFIVVLFIFGVLKLNAQNKINDTPQKSDLIQVLQQNKDWYTKGKVADYIPELSKVDASKMAVTVIDKNGKIISVGDVHQKFTIQSISKIISLMIAVQENGEANVFKNMGYYGTHVAFNYFENLAKQAPLNPLMNAGAILTTSMISGTSDEKFNKILNLIRYITKNDEIKLNAKVFLSEKSTGNRNRAMFYLLKNNSLINNVDEKVLDVYFKQCSVEVNTEDLAKIGYFFANDCVRFDGDAIYKNKNLAQLIKSQMLIAGMYDYSGKYAREIGIPSKSGVGGGIVASVPYRFGVGVFSPALDKHGNSLAGFHVLLHLSQQFGWSIF